MSDRSVSNESAEGAASESQVREKQGKKPGRFTPSRRGFVTALGAGSVGVLLAKEAGAVTVGPLNPTQRRDRAFQLRQNQAIANRDATSLVVQPTNGDEEQLANKIGSYTKGLPHNNRGEVDINAYNSLLLALRTAAPADFENIILGGPRKLINPQSGWKFEIEGADPASWKIPVPPKFNSREEGAEISENYWMALLRDVPFAQYPTNQIAIDAAADLTRWGADFKGPKNGSTVTPDLLFRGLTAGDRVGPYASQFYYQPIVYGVQSIEQRFQHSTAVNFLTDFPSFLAVQNGTTNVPVQQFENVLRYLRNGRGAGDWVHFDNLFQSAFNAFLIAQSYGPDTLSTAGAVFEASNPYKNSRTQLGLGTFGFPNAVILLTEVHLRALHAAWYQKWFAHRRLRPEAFGGAVHTRLYQSTAGDGSQNRFPINQELLDSVTSSARLGKYLPPGNALLTQGFPEGSPTHPAYTAGHATCVGANVTMLKAFFNENFVIPNPVRPSDDGLTLLPFSGTLTLGNELDKLASNQAIFRGHAGVHWRSDHTQSLLLGEAIAIEYLREERPTFNEAFSGFVIRKFDGTTVTI